MVSGWSTHLLKASKSPTVEFFLNLCVALLWKYMVLLSPLLSHKIRAHWFHILASMSSKILISNCNSWTRKLRPLCKASLSALSNAFFFFSNSRLTFPNTFLFHHAKSLPHLSTLLMTEPLVSHVAQEFHTASTIFPHLLSESHISSKWKTFFWGGGPNSWGWWGVGNDSMIDTVGGRPEFQENDETSSL